MPDIAMHLLDIVYNSIRAAASSIHIYLLDSQIQDLIICRVEDNGCGMDAKTVEAVQSPFYTTRTTRDVGLGVPLFKEGALQAGGSFSLQSQPGQGTVIEARYRRSHLDCPAMGDLAETMVTLIQADDAIVFDLTYDWDQGNFQMNTAEIKEILDGVPINTPEVILWLKEYIKEGIKR